MPGAAVTEVRIDGISHEYSAVPGAQEDVIAILLNLKNLAVRMHNRDEAVLRVSKKGPGAVTAGDIQLDHDVEVVNPDHLLANLSAEGELNMEITVSTGRGYQVVESDPENTETRGVGILRLDASYSPIRRVSYTCLVYTPDAADDPLRVELGGRRDIKAQTLTKYQRHNSATIAQIALSVRLHYR